MYLCNGGCLGVVFRFGVRYERITQDNGVVGGGGMKNMGQLSVKTNMLG